MGQNHGGQMSQNTGVMRYLPSGCDLWKADETKERLRARTSETVAYLAGKPKEDCSMQQRETRPKAFTARSPCLARHGEAELPNLTSNGESHARRCTERLLRR